MATIRTSAGLRETLFDTIDKVIAGELAPEHAKSVAVLSKEICNTVQLEIQINRLRTEYPADMKLSLPGTVTLGERKDNALEAKRK